MSRFHQPAQLATLGQTWVEAWNTRDLERVLTLYDEDAVMTSDRIPVMGFDASGTVRGKDALRAYGARRSPCCRSCISLSLMCSSALTASWCFTRTSAGRRSANIYG